MRCIRIKTVDSVSEEQIYYQNTIPKMGVRGLLTYIKKNPATRDRHVSLRTLASRIRQRTGKQAQLLFDFLNVLYWLLGSYHEAMIKKSHYKMYSFIYGGHLKDHERRFLSFIRAINSLDIEVVMFMDGARGSDRELFNAKKREYISKFHHRNTLIKKCIEIEDCNEYGLWMPQPLLILHLLMALKRKQFKVLHCTGEADGHIAAYAQTYTESVCGILTNDTDLIMMDNCDVFFCDLFDRDDTLKIRQVEFNEKPEDIVVEKTNKIKLSGHFKIKPEDMVNISIICGNDYTKHLCRSEVARPFPDSHNGIEQAIQWIKQHSTDESAINLLDFEPFKTFYENAIEYTRKAYSPSLQSENEVQASLSPLYREGKIDFMKEVQEGKMTRDIMPIVINGIHWNFNRIEDLPPSKIINLLLISFHQLVYTLLGIDSICEYTCDDDEHQMDYAVLASVITKEPFPNLLMELRQKNEIQKLCIYFTLLANHTYYQSKTNFNSMLKHYSTVQMKGNCMEALISPLTISGCILLACKLNKDFLSAIAQNSLLIACIMCSYGRDPFKTMYRPTSEALNYSSGFSAIMEGAYQLASVLGILEFMPLPSSIYENAALIPFHHIASCKLSDLKHKRKLDQQLNETIIIYEYMRKNKHYIELKDILFKELQSNEKTLFTPEELIGIAKHFTLVMFELEEAIERADLLQKDLISLHTKGNNSTKCRNQKSYFLCNLTFSGKKCKSRKQESITK